MITVNVTQKVIDESAALLALHKVRRSVCPVALALQQALLTRIDLDPDEPTVLAFSEYVAVRVQGKWRQYPLLCRVTQWIRDYDARIAPVEPIAFKVPDPQEWPLMLDSK